MEKTQPNPITKMPADELLTALEEIATGECGHRQAVSIARAAIAKSNGLLTHTKMEDFILTASHIAQAKKWGWEIVTRAEFESLTPDKMANGVPSSQENDLRGLKERVAEFPGAYVLYDPNDDDEGFLLVHDNPQVLIDELMERVEFITLADRPL